MGKSSERRPARRGRGPALFQDPTVGLCLGPSDSARGEGVLDDQHGADEEEHVARKYPGSAQERLVHRAPCVTRKAFWATGKVFGDTGFLVANFNSHGGSFGAWSSIFGVIVGHDSNFWCHGGSCGVRGQPAVWKSRQSATPSLSRRSTTKALTCVHPSASPWNTHVPLSSSPRHTCVHLSSANKTTPHPARPAAGRTRPHTEPACEHTNPHAAAPAREHASATHCTTGGPHTCHTQVCSPVSTRPPAQSAQSSYQTDSI